MNKLLSCEFNIDTGNVECRFADGTMISIDCDVVEDTIDGTLPFVRVRTELDWLIYENQHLYSKEARHRKEQRVLVHLVVLQNI